MARGPALDRVVEDVFVADDDLRAAHWFETTLRAAHWFETTPTENQSTRVLKKDGNDMVLRALQCRNGIRTRGY